MSTKLITPQQYADYRDCTPFNIRKHIRANNLKRLPDVISIKNYGRFVLLEVSDALPVPEQRKFKNTDKLEEEEFIKKQGLIKNNASKISQQSWE